jgi:hypothetical protein
MTSPPWFQRRGSRQRSAICHRSTRPGSLLSMTSTSATQLPHHAGAFLAVGRLDDVVVLVDHPTLTTNFNLAASIRRPASRPRPSASDPRRSGPLGALAGRALEGAFLESARAGARCAPTPCGACKPDTSDARWSRQPSLKSPSPDHTPSVAGVFDYYCRFRQRERARSDRIDSAGPRASTACVAPPPSPKSPKGWAALIGAEYSAS